MILFQFKLYNDITSPVSHNICAVISGGMSDIYLPLWAKLMHQHLGTLWLRQLIHYSSVTEPERKGESRLISPVISNYYVVLIGAFVQIQGRCECYSCYKIDFRCKTHISSFMHSCDPFNNSTGSAYRKLILFLSFFSCSRMCNMFNCLLQQHSKSCFE